MNQTVTAVAKNDGEWWIGWVEEVPGVNCQERFRDELLKTLRVALLDALEMNRADARDAGVKECEERSIVVCSVANSRDSFPFSAAFLSVKAGAIRDGRTPH